MRVSTFFFAAAFVFAASAASADDPMSVTYGNTVTTKNTKTGVTGELLFNADGTYQANGVGADGKPVEYPGNWAVKDNGATLCLTPQLPANTPNAPGPSCSPLSVHIVGSSAAPRVRASMLWSPLAAERPV